MIKQSWHGRVKSAVNANADFRAALLVQHSSAEARDRLAGYALAWLQGSKPYPCAFVWRLKLALTLAYQASEACKC